jgi:hypothetical protein
MPFSINVSDRKSTCVAASPVRRRAGLLKLAILWLAALGPAVHADELYVVCGASVTLAMADIRDVFLGEKQFAGPIKLVPVDNSAMQPDFLAKVMKMDAGKYTTAWTKKSFRDGFTPPSVKGADGEVVEFLKHTPGACGYLGSPPPPGLMLIGKL